MSKDTGKLDIIRETGGEAQKNIAESAAKIEYTVENNTAIERPEMEAMTLDEQTEKAEVFHSAGEVEAEAEKGRETKDNIVEANVARENESTVEWLERLERESRAADERAKQTATALKSAREVEAEAKREAAHTRNRLKKSNEQVRETLDAKYSAECSTELVIRRLQTHKIQAAKNAADQAVREARERARFEAEEAKWKAKKAQQEAKYRAKWKAETSDEPGEKEAALKSVGEVKAEAKRETVEIRERLHQAILQAKREAQEATDRAKSDVMAAGQEISKEVKERIEKLHVAILRAIENRNQIRIESDTADERAIKKVEALKSAGEACDEAKRQATVARKRLREAMLKAKKEGKEDRSKARRKAREATMVALSNELSGYSKASDSQAGKT